MGKYGKIKKKPIKFLWRRALPRTILSPPLACCVLRVYNGSGTFFKENRKRSRIYNETRDRGPAQRGQIHPFSTPSPPPAMPRRPTIRSAPSSRTPGSSPCRTPGSTSWPKSGRPTKKTPATVEFVDIAGLVKGASQGAGLGNKFLGHIRECDAIVHVVRCFDDDNIIHVVEGRQQARKRRPHPRHRSHRPGADPLRPRDGAEPSRPPAEAAKTGNKAAAAEAAWLAELAAHLEAGKPARTFAFDAQDAAQNAARKELGLLSAQAGHLRLQRRRGRPARRHRRKPLLSACRGPAPRPNTPRPCRSAPRPRRTSPTPRRRKSTPFCRRWASRPRP